MVAFAGEDKPSAEQDDDRGGGPAGGEELARGAHGGLRGVGVVGRFFAALREDHFLPDEAGEAGGGVE